MAVYSKTIVCLANSKKHQEHCIAGKVLLDNGHLGEWVRPVSNRSGHGISVEELTCANKRQTKLLDIISVPFVAPSSGFPFQTENHIIDASQKWDNRGSFPWANILYSLDSPNELWDNSTSSSVGSHDQVSLESALSFKYSLVLIQPKHLVLRKQHNSYEPEKPKIRALFEYRNTSYNLQVTDLEVLHRVQKVEYGDYPVAEAILCVSLAEPFSKRNNFCYKVVAAVISKNLYEGSHG